MDFIQEKQRRTAAVHCRLCGDCIPACFYWGKRYRFVRQCVFSILIGMMLTVLEEQDQNYGSRKLLSFTSKKYSTRDLSLFLRCCNLSEFAKML